VAESSVDEYRAPLFVAWQLTNRCSARCVTCCEESGPNRSWVDEFTRAEALTIARRIVEDGIPYVAFGGGEPLGVPHCWELFQLLADGGTALKIETDGRHIDEAGADRLAELGVQCVQISVDGASAAVHERVRPGSSFDSAIRAIERLTQRGCAPQFVFVPNRLNIHETVAAFDLAVALGCDAFVTGPMMRIGRAAANWEEISCDPDAWQRTEHALRERARSIKTRTRLAIYPWDILEEMRRRLTDPQAMLLVVPNGKVKLLNALPFAPADLRRDSLATAWQAYLKGWRHQAVRDFITACNADPRLLRHANETWPMDPASEH